MNNTVVIIGAGFSKASGIPSTNELNKYFIDFESTSTTTREMQDEISRQLLNFWGNIFGYKQGNDPPSFEDHFTVLDLAANAGHNLGNKYWPSRLRAIRRISIHRVFDILDSRYKHNNHTASFIESLVNGSENVIISTNWDIVVEKLLIGLGKNYDYSIPIYQINGEPNNNTGLLLLKLHGSSNWAYCDCCRRTYEFPKDSGKGTLHSWTFLEQRDFRVLPGQGKNVRGLFKNRKPTSCPFCGVNLSSRVGTFSFSKALGFYQFQGIWESALTRLRTSNRWIFIGYSLPDADFTLKHLLKTAQLADISKFNKEIIAVTYNDCESIKRYQKFFGDHLSHFEICGFDEWYKKLNNGLTNKD